MDIIEEKRPILVIGGSGFVGYHITKALLESSSWSSVHVASRNPNKNMIPGVQYHATDLASRDDVRKLIAIVNPIGIIHSASPAHQGPHVEASSQYRIVNIEGTKNLLDAVVENGGVEAFVYTSTTNVMAGDQFEFVAEEAQLWQANDSAEVYSKTKAAADRIVRSHNGVNALRTLCLRCCIIYGERNEQLIPQALQSLDKGQHVYQIGRNENSVDFVSVANVVDAHLLALSKLLGMRDEVSLHETDRIDGEAFFITDGRPEPFWTFMRRIWSHSTSTTDTTQIHIVPAWIVLVIAAIVEWAYIILTIGSKHPVSFNRQILRFTCKSQTFSIEKAKQRLGYAPIDDRNDQLRAAVTWERNQQALRKDKSE